MIAFERPAVRCRAHINIGAAGWSLKETYAALFRVDRRVAMFSDRFLSIEILC